MNGCRIACAAPLGHATFDSCPQETHHNSALMNDFSACLKEGAFDEITRLTKEAVEIVRTAREVYYLPINGSISIYGEEDGT